MAAKTGRRHGVRGHQDDGHDQQKGGGGRLNALLDDEPANVGHPGDAPFEIPGAPAREVRHR
jgi:hypothetical protein